ncbi:hypothetical protein PSAC2689_50361 [Paraburkholderia sacchari]
MCKYLFFHFRLAMVLIVVTRTKWVGEAPESAGAIGRVLSNAAISLLLALFHAVSDWSHPNSLPFSPLSAAPPDPSERS